VCSSAAELFKTISCEGFPQQWAEVLAALIVFVKYAALLAVGTGFSPLILSPSTPPHGGKST
jgi:hypothetical protein